MDGDDFCTPHYRVSFFCRDGRYRCLPDTTISIASTAEEGGLNEVVRELLKKIPVDDCEAVRFDFLVGNSVLRSSLQKFIDENSISTESVIKVECILKEVGPKPQNELEASDWVGAIQSTKEFSACGIYDGSLLFCNHHGSQITSINPHEQAIKCLSLLRGSESRIATGSSDQLIILSDIFHYKDHLVVSPTHVLRGHGRSVECLACNSDGSRLISGSFDHMLKVWNTSKDDSKTNFVKSDGDKPLKRWKSDAITKLPMVTLSGHKDAIVGAAWLPFSEKKVCTASWDHTILTWDLELAGNISSMSFNKSFTSISVCPSSEMLITGSVDPFVRLWDPRSSEGSFIKQVYVGHTGWISSVQWSPVNEYNFISSSYDKSCKLWDTRINKTPLYNLCGHTDRVLCCDWSLKELIVTGGADCSVKTFSRY